MPDWSLGAIEPAATVPAPRQRLCASAALLERGRAHVFDVLRFGQPARGFVLRFDGAVVAYLNRCVHVPTELDWQPGEFLDAGRQFILCSIHGAAYAPHSGRCLGGPCANGRLLALEVGEAAGEVWWQPTRDTKPAPATLLQGSPSQ